MNKSSLHSTVDLTLRVMRTPLVHADRLEEAQESGRIGGHELPRIANPSAPDFISGREGRRSSKKNEAF